MHEYLKQFNRRPQPTLHVMACCPCRETAAKIALWIFSRIYFTGNIAYIFMKFSSAPILQRWDHSR